ncbi:triphosphoribosyl-dephospho-CoA synthase [Rhodopirellula sp. SWK7]|uniref:triphosphoribosyl-dephospho-CoA synthase n=1 Tax=Rhodopirellula sp. SWK7 TaxID=595460 RepID=UPI00034B27E3|nr:triphosphoribosyl-dephospho-CoA synthase [Rhodopirellula sp. SWK7]
MSDSRPIASRDSPWRVISSATRCRADAVLMACVLEATAPKVGNVHPAARFDDLAYADFVIAAGMTADALGNLKNDDPIGDAIASAVRASVEATGTNVNLGIVLLLAPLVASEPDWSALNESQSAKSFDQRCRQWQDCVELLLADVDLQQGAKIAGAISGAAAGGLDGDSLGEDHPLDVNGGVGMSYDILAAMRLASTRDRIARQYAEGYRDLFDVVVPTVRERVARTGDLLSGIVLAHIELIAAEGDSLIARKCGSQESARVAELARECLAAIDGSDLAQMAEHVRVLDEQLRADGNRFNPGTSADLIAAAVYVLLRVI